jgi:hypothetical protein
MTSVAFNKTLSYAATLLGAAAKVRCGTEGALAAALHQAAITRALS